MTIFVGSFENAGTFHSACTIIAKLSAQKNAKSDAPTVAGAKTPAADKAQSTLPSSKPTSACTTGTQASTTGAQAIPKPAPKIVLPQIGALKSTPNEAQAPQQGIHADDLSSDDATVQFARRSHLKFDANANLSQQLTIEELDFALRRLVDRIETLEKANQNNIETGKSALNTDLAEVPHKI